MRNLNNTEGVAASTIEVKNKSNAHEVKVNNEKKRNIIKERIRN